MTSVQADELIDALEASTSSLSGVEALFCWLFVLAGFVAGQGVWRLLLIAFTKKRIFLWLALCLAASQAEASYPNQASLAYYSWGTRNTWTTASSRRPHTVVYKRCGTWHVWTIASNGDGTWSETGRPSDCVINEIALLQPYADQSGLSFTGSVLAAIHSDIRLHTGVSSVTRYSNWMTTTGTWNFPYVAQPDCGACETVVPLVTEAQGAELIAAAEAQAERAEALEAMAAWLFVSLGWFSGQMTWRLMLISFSSPAVF